MTCWVGVASRSHVRQAVEGGFCQLAHGREAPLKRLARGDRILYYSSREEMRAGGHLQAFTAIGEIEGDAPYRAQRGCGCEGFRRDVRYLEAKDAPIRPMLDDLAFTRGNARWGLVLRRGLVEIGDEDYRTIATAMGVRPAD